MCGTRHHVSDPSIGICSEKFLLLPKSFSLGFASRFLLFGNAMPIVFHLTGGVSLPSRPIDVYHFVQQIRPRATRATQSKGVSLPRAFRVTDDSPYTRSIAC
jgi:hypothetical protein